MNARVVSNSSSDYIRIANSNNLETSSEVFINDLNGDVHIYPNPFNTFITIAYSLTKDSNIEIKIFNNQGKEEATLVDNDPKEQGKHHVNFGSTSLRTGIFHYVIKTNEYTKSGNL